MHTTIIEINSQQFITNLCSIRSNIPNTVKLCLPVKANAYGHGITGIAKLAEPYVDYLAVACLDEGALLRNSGITKPILVFGAFNQDQVAGLIANNLEITVSSQFKAEQLVNYCKQTGQTCKIHLKVDTGMQRVGVRVSSLPALLEYALANSELQIIGVYSHLANSELKDDAITFAQIEQFATIAAIVKQKNPNIICHLANSGGLCYYPQSYFDMVRPGLLSYGYFPGQARIASTLEQIKPCFSLKSRVIYTKMVDAGQGISYNHSYKTKEYTRVVTIPLGYGDGYRRMLSNVGEVLLRGKKYTISGNICMDMFLVDIGPRDKGYVEDEVVLIGQQGNEEITLESVACKCHTITYEILCGFTERIPRVYV